MKKRKSTDSKGPVAETVPLPTTSPQAPVEIIIKVGTEGRDWTFYGEDRTWTLFGRKKSPADDWEFAADGDVMNGFEDRFTSKTEWVNDWKSALKLYANHPWHLLCPLEVHRDFREAVQLALEEQLMHDERLTAQDESGIEVNYWLPLCDERVQEKILQVQIVEGEEYWTLFGIRDGRSGWHFYTDWSLCEEEPIARLIPQNQPLPVSVPTWEEALELFDQRAWAQASPTYVHPEFRARVKSLVIRRKFGAISSGWQNLMA